jgi:hypothetical protein
MQAKLYTQLWLLAWHAARVAIWLYPKLVG